MQQLILRIAFSLQERKSFYIPEMKRESNCDWVGGMIKTKLASVVGQSNDNGKDIPHRNYFEVTIVG